MYICEKICGSENFRVGFASEAKALAWFDENYVRYCKLRALKNLKHDAYLRIDQQYGEGELVNVKIGQIKRCYERPTEQESSVKFNGNELVALRVALTEQWAKVAYHMEFMQEEHKRITLLYLDKLVKKIDKALTDYEEINHD